MCPALLCCAPQHAWQQQEIKCYSLYTLAVCGCKPSVIHSAAAHVKATATAVSTPAGEGNVLQTQGVESDAAWCSAAEQALDVFHQQHWEQTVFKAVACIIGTHILGWY